MIARFRMLLPYIILVAPDDAPEPVELTVAGATLAVFPPYRASLDPAALDMDSTVPLSQLPPALVPADPQPRSENTRMSGREVVPANALRIDANGDFDRTNTNDPPTDAAFVAANTMLIRLRHLARAQQIKPISPSSTIWSMRYLNDDETEFPQAEGYYRGRFGASWSISYLGLPPDLWNAAAALPDSYTPSPAATLLLDAYGLVAEIGPALVLAASAIETRIDSALDILAKNAGLEPEFWKWLTERGGQYHKEPSFTEKLDPLLRGVANTSLKDDAALWQAFQDIRKARNSFAHEGVARIGAVDVTFEKALELIRSADLIVDWIEALLPEDDRRLPLSKWAQIETTRMLVAPYEPQAERPADA